MVEKQKYCKNHLVATCSDQKMKVFSYPLTNQLNYVKFKENLKDNVKEVLEHFEKLPVENGELSIFYFDIEGEKTYPVYEIRFNY